MSEFIVKIDNENFAVNTNHNEKITVNGKTHNLEIVQLSDHTFNVKVDNNIFHVTSSKLLKDKFSFLIDGHYFESIVKTKLENEAEKLLNNLDTKNGRNEVKSPMPGLILRVEKNIGDEVRQGEAIVLLEAMKMENEIRSPADGVISEILISEGKSVEKNQVLIVID